MSSQYRGVQCDQDKCDSLGRSYHCDNDRCIPSDWACDSVNNCWDNSDEMSCDQNKCNILGRPHYCDNMCLPNEMVCDGLVDCIDKSDEEKCDQDKCDSLGRSYHRDNKCIPSDFVCDGEEDCLDNSDERPEICFPKNVEPSSMVWIAAPIVLGVTAIIVGAIYGCCARKSYRTLRQDDQESSKGQLIGQALRHPLSFRQRQQHLNREERINFDYETAA